jgi:hypothetical protein
MKRDMDLVRSILLTIEQSPQAKIARIPSIGSYTDDELAEHTRLAFSAGLLEGVQHQSMKGPPQFLNVGLTWDGHEFLEKIRDPDVWDKTKTAAGKVGSWSLPLLADLALGYAKAKAASLGFPIA